MSNKTKVLIIFVITLLLVVISVGGYGYLKKMRQVSQEKIGQNVAQDTKEDAATKEPEKRDLDENVSKEIKDDNPNSADNLKKGICGKNDIAKGKTLEAGKQYVTRIQNIDQSAVAYYNHYLFCKLFTGADVNGVLAGIINSDSGGFSQKDFASEWFIKLKASNDIFKSKSCDSQEVSMAVFDYKRALLSPKEGSAPSNLPDNINGGLRSNLVNISSADLCGFFKRTSGVVDRLERDNFCAGNLECQGLLKDDTDVCSGFGNDADRKMCVDSVLYFRALRNNDPSACSKVETFHRNIACQAYFLKNDAGMCDGLSNDINEKFCK